MQVPKSVYEKHVKYEKGHHSNTRRRYHGTSCSSDCNYFFDLKVSNSYILRCALIGRVSPQTLRRLHHPVESFQLTY